MTTIVAAAHLLGYLFERIKQPRLIGEILAGVLVGPFVLGRLVPSASAALLGRGTSSGDPTSLILNYTYWLGLFLLMFISGSEVRRVLGRENRKPTAWILAIGTPLPFFVALGIGSFLPLDRLTGDAGQESSALLVLAIAVAVTSIPVISRIFFDLRILHTRFASLILGAALLEDIMLWAVLAVATSLAATSGLGQNLVAVMTEHVGLTLAYMAAGLFVAPPLLRRLHVARCNILVKSTPVGYACLILFSYVAVAAVLDVNVVFAAFLAGFGLVGGTSGSERRRFAPSLDAIQQVAMGIFVPVYFAIVGTQLDFGEGFSVALLVVFLVGSSTLCLFSIGLAARMAGFRGIEIVNIAVASNARGGPGIVLASVAFEAGIINGAFFTTLVLTAILTSQFAGWWLWYVLHRRWPLLRKDELDVVGDEDRASPTTKDESMNAGRAAEDAVEGVSNSGRNESGV